MLCLQWLTSLKCEMAQEGMPLVRGHIYIASADVLVRFIFVARLDIEAKRSWYM